MYPWEVRKKVKKIHLLSPCPLPSQQSLMPELVEQKFLDCHKILYDTNWNLRYEHFPANETADFWGISGKKSFYLESPVQNTNLSDFQIKAKTQQIDSQAWKLPEKGMSSLKVLSNLQEFAIFIYLFIITVVFLIF